MMKWMAALWIRLSYGVVDRATSPGVEPGTSACADL
jgi:hypothetical protein